MGFCNLHLHLQVKFVWNPFSVLNHPQLFTISWSCHLFAKSEEGCKADCFLKGDRRKEILFIEVPFQRINLRNNFYHSIQLRRNVSYIRIRAKDSFICINKTLRFMSSLKIAFDSGLIITKSQTQIRLCDMQKETVNSCKNSNKISP